MDRFRPGMIFTEEVTLDAALVEKFAEFSGDRNPVHLQAEAAREFGFSRPFAHGAILSAIVSKLIGMKVPGPGAVWMSQSMEWARPIFVGETVKVEAEIESASSGAEVLTLKLRASLSGGEQVMQGSAKVKVAPKIAERTETAGAQEQRVALVTGGSRGIGAAMARALGAAGYQVVLTYHANRAAADEVAASILRGGSAAEAMAADLSLPGSGTTLVAKVIAQFGRVDTIVHAATQHLPAATVAETSCADLQKYSRVHVEAALELAQAAAADMGARKFGRMIFLGTSALFGPPPPKMAAYVTAKQALWGLVRCLAAELGPQQITVNMISPGMTVTDLTADIPARIKEAEARRTALRRLALPEDVAQVAAFLASDAGGYITGQNLPVTGVGV
jgi:3-oxoacyl-[acyl-carrier protein] reductase